MYFSTPSLRPLFTTKRALGGTGLGLSIVKNIVEIHRGAVKIENNKEGGLKMILAFPVLLSHKREVGGFYG